MQTRTQLCSSPAAPTRRARVALWAVQGYAALGLALLSYLFFSRCIMTTVEVRGQSMAPTLRHGDRFLLDRFSRWYRPPARGELVVLVDPEHGEYAVKRVVGLPGEHLQIRRNIAYIEGQRLMEPYLASDAAAEEAVLEVPLEVPADCYFVMGDNRSNSEDSRHYGAVPRKNILGVLRVGPQPEAFLRQPADQAGGLLSLRTMPVAAAERR